jgi:hypothetical protein
MSKFAAWSVVSWTFSCFGAGLEIVVVPPAVSTGRRVPLGGAALAIAFAVMAAVSHARSIGTTQASTRVYVFGSSSIELMPTSSPFVLKTGPPAVSRPIRRSAKIACEVTRVTSPSTTSLPDNIGAVIVLSSSWYCVRGASAPPQRSSIGGIDPIAPGSIQITAPPVARSSTITVPGTLK